MHDILIFIDSKLILSLYDEATSCSFAEDMRSKIVLPGIKNKDLDVLATANGINLAKLAIQYSDGVIMGSANIHEELVSFVEASKLPTLPYVEINTDNSEYIKKYNEFYDTILENNAI